MEEGKSEGGEEVQARERIFKFSFAMLKCVYSPVYISVYLSSAIFQYLLLGFCGVGGGWILGSTLLALILFGCCILMVLELVGGKFISPITFAETLCGEALLL